MIEIADFLPGNTKRVFFVRLAIFPSVWQKSDKNLTKLKYLRKYLTSTIHSFFQKYGSRRHKIESWWQKQVNILKKPWRVINTSWINDFCEYFNKTNHEFPLAQIVSNYFQDCHDSGFAIATLWYTDSRYQFIRIVNIISFISRSSVAKIKNSWPSLKISIDSNSVPNLASVLEETLRRNKRNKKKSEVLQFKLKISISKLTFFSQIFDQGQNSSISRRKSHMLWKRCQSIRTSQNCQVHTPNFAAMIYDWIKYKEMTTNVSYFLYVYIKKCCLCGQLWVFSCSCSF